jgi:hypothetical protein
MRNFCVFLIFVTLAVSGWCQSTQPPISTPRTSQPFDGEWWVRADKEERYGFMNGAADCLTWTAHEEGFSGTPEQPADKISKFYKAHPEAANLAVVDVWKKVAVQPGATKSPEPQGETWKNTHWYLNGLWWRGGTLLEEKGYLQGYLWCMNNRIDPKTDSYSRPVSYYQKKIDAYIKAHPNSDDEAVANILHRYRDENATTPSIR